MTAKKAQAESPIDEIRGASPHIVGLKKEIRNIAPRDLTVFIMGETGTGKDLIAKAIHELSPRKDRPFMPVDCGGIPSDLFEGRLFGHKRGSFTGADRDAPGLIEAAKGGTLFLDEVGNLRVDHQAKILRLLQNGAFIPIGGLEEEAADVRVVAATNNPRALREDLVQRLRQRVIRTRPLAERPEDIIVLLNHFIRNERRKRVGPNPRVKFLLYSYSFPGNVRELINLSLNADDYPYICTEIVAAWADRWGVEEDEVFSLIEEHGYDLFANDRAWYLPIRGMEIVKFHSDSAGIATPPKGFEESLNVFKVIALLGPGPGGLGDDSTVNDIVQAYEIITLRQCPSMRVKDVSSLLSLRSEITYRPGFKKRFGLDLAGYTDRSPTPLFPGFYDLWRKQTSQ